MKTNIKEKQKEKKSVKMRWSCYEERKKDRMK